MKNGHTRGDHLNRAILAIGRARAEFDRAKQSRDELNLAQAAEKAWLATVEATKAYLRAKGITEGKLPEGQRAEFHLLRKLGGAGLGRTYAYVGAILHSRTFYQGVVDWKLSAEALGQAEGFVSRVQSLAAHR